MLVPAPTATKWPRARLSPTACTGTRVHCCQGLKTDTSAGHRQRQEDASQRREELQACWQGHLEALLGRQERRQAELEEQAAQRAELELAADRCAGCGMQQCDARMCWKDKLVQQAEQEVVAGRWAA